MKRRRLTTMHTVAILAGGLLFAAGAVRAQDYGPQPFFAPRQVDALVSRIALYPDPLLAQVLAAATYPDQIPDAARWASSHQYLRGDNLADAMAWADLPWDPSVQALIPFPDVLAMMAGDMNWTSQLGNAVLAQRSEVMDAVQRMRREAASYGYLRSSEQIRVIDQLGYVQILPYNPAVIYVPVYDPYVVYSRPRPGFYVGTAIRFSNGFSLGVFGNWGWGGGFDWRQHTVIVNQAAWNRNWTNRHAYIPGPRNWAVRSGTANRTVIVNNNINPRRDVVNDRNLGPADRTYSPPNLRREVTRGVQSAPNLRESYRGTAPAPVVPAARSYDPRSTPDRNPGHNSGSISRGIRNEDRSRR